MSILLKSITLTVFVSVSLLMSACGTGQAALEAPEFDPLPEGATVYIVADEMPEMIGGQESLYSNLEYPLSLRNRGVEGRTMVSIIVGPDGEIAQLEVLGSSGNRQLDVAALRAVAETRFTPGVKDGEAVYVQMVQPVVFSRSR